MQTEDTKREMVRINGEISRVIKLLESTMSNEKPHAILLQELRRLYAELSDLQEQKSYPRA